MATSSFVLPNTLPPQLGEGDLMTNIQYPISLVVVLAIEMTQANLLPGPVGKKELRASPSM